MDKENLDGELSNWSRHYDTLLWNSTTAFVGLLGALAAVSFENFHWLLSVVGLSFSFVPVYFAASFRESRDIVHKAMSPGLRVIVFSDRRLKQWPLFVFIFICLEGLHFYLLVEHDPEKLVCWAMLFFVIAMFTGFGIRFGKLQTRNTENHRAEEGQGQAQTGTSNQKSGEQPEVKKQKG